MLEGFHLRVERLIGAVLGPQGFALGGGYGLQVHGLVDRLSDDLDNYTASMDPNAFVKADRSICAALREDGLEAQVISSDSWFRQIIVSDPRSGERVSVDLGYDYRQHEPVIVSGVGPVVAVEDVILGKVRALSDRAAERDFFDVDAILTSGRWTAQDLYSIMKVIRPEWSMHQFQELLRSAHRGNPVVYESLGMNTEQIKAMCGRLSDQATALENEPAAYTQAPNDAGRSSRCRVCHRPLRLPESIQRGFGPGCAKKS